MILPAKNKTSSEEYCIRGGGHSTMPPKKTLEALTAPVDRDDAWRRMYFGLATPSAAKKPKKGPADFVVVLTAAEKAAKGADAKLSRSRAPRDMVRGDDTAGTGLRNLGATCYMNALLQSMHMDLGFRRGIYRWAAAATSVGAAGGSSGQPPPAEAAEGAASSGGSSRPQEEVRADEVCRQLQLVFAHLQHSVGQCYDPMALATALRLKVSVQQDVMEFRKLLLTFLERQLKLSPVASVHTLIEDHFGGLFSYHVECSACHRPSDSSAACYPFYELELNVRPTLQQALNEYIVVEHLDGSNQYECTNCHGQRDATRKIAIRLLPPVLCLHLKRFAVSASGAEKKVSDPIIFPELLDTSSFVFDPASAHSSNAPSGQAPHSYRLTAVLLHSGASVHSGHYTARILEQSPAARWLTVNDELVTEEGFDPAKAATKPKPNGVTLLKQSDPSGGRLFASHEAYLLMYTRNDVITQAQTAHAEVQAPEVVREAVRAANVCLTARQTLLNDDEQTLSDAGVLPNSTIHVYVDTSRKAELPANEMALGSSIAGEPRELELGFGGTALVSAARHMQAIVTHAPHPANPKRRETVEKRQELMEQLVPCQQLLMHGVLPENANTAVWSNFGTLTNGQLEIRQSNVKRIIGDYVLGRGLFARREYVVHEIITVYGGELITQGEAKRRKEDRESLSRRYLMRISDSDFLVDGWQFASGISDTPNGPDGSFLPVSEDATQWTQGCASMVNHDPANQNAYLSFLALDARSEAMRLYPRIPVLRAHRRISPGEEILFNYGSSMPFRTAEGTVLGKKRSAAVTAKGVTPAAPASSPTAPAMQDIIVDLLACLNVPPDLSSEQLVELQMLLKGGVEVCLEEASSLVSAAKKAKKIGEEPEAPLAQSSSMAPLAQSSSQHLLLPPSQSPPSPPKMDKRRDKQEEHDALLRSAEAKLRIFKCFDTACAYPTWPESAYLSWPEITELAIRAGVAKTPKKSMVSVLRGTDWIKALMERILRLPV